MESSKDLLCSSCKNQMLLSNGDYLFTYNVECSNNHKINNMDLDELLLKREKSSSLLYCKTHNKKNRAHCFNCKEDICMLCVNSSHKLHKMEYLKSLYLSLSEEHNLPKLFKKEKKMTETFLSELIIFKNKINSYVDDIQSQIRKEIELRSELLNKVLQKEYTYIDILNLKTILDNKSLAKINDNINNFCKQKTFLEKYDIMRNIFNEGILKGKYIENKNYFNIIQYKFNPNTIFINEDFYVEILLNEKFTYCNIFQKNNKLYLKNNNDQIKCISRKYIGHYEYCEDVIFKDYNRINNEFSFFTILKNRIKKDLLEIKIKLNIFDNNIEYEIKTINIILNGLIHLDENKNIVFTNKEIILYDNLFNLIKILTKKNYDIYSWFKIDENTISYSFYDYCNLYIASIDDFNDINEYFIPNCGGICIGYLKKI